VSKYLTFIEYFFSKIQDGAHQYGVFLASFSRSFAFVRNFKMQIFLHTLEEQTKKKFKILLPKNKFKMAAKFKMATKTKFALKTLNHLF
jgi:hypothetical protein